MHSRNLSPLPNIRVFLETVARNQISDEEKDIFRDLLVTLDRVTQRANLTFFLFAGSLLGLERFEDMLPWDDDMDVAMNFDDKEELIKALEEANMTNKVKNQIITKKKPGWIEMQQCPFPDRYRHYKQEGLRTEDLASYQIQGIDEICLEVAFRRHFLV